MDQNLVPKQVRSLKKSDINNSASTSDGTGKNYTPKLLSNREQNSKTDDLVYGKWATLPLNNFYKISIYGAYFDDRLQKAPVLRILAVLPFKSVKLLSDFRCQVTFNDSTVSHLTTLSDITPQRHMEMKLKGVANKVVSMLCQPKLWTHKRSSLAEKLMLIFHNQSVTLPVTYPPKDAGTLDRIVLCVGCLYGFMDEREARAMVEWVETNVMFGISEIHLYNCSLWPSDSIRRVMDYYVGLNILHIIWFPPPVSDWLPEEFFPATGLSSKVGINHCLLMNSKRALAVVIQDYDEILAPSKNWTYQKIANYLLEHKDRPASIHFWANDIYLDFPPSGPVVAKNGRDPALIVEKFQRSIKYDGKYYFVKSVFLPSRCSLLHPHHCQIAMDKGMKDTILGQDQLTYYHFRRQCAQSYDVVMQKNGTQLVYSEDMELMELCERRRETFKLNSDLSVLNEYFTSIRARTETVYEKLNLELNPNY